MTAKAKVEQVTIPAIEIETFTIRLIGDSPLIMHKWSEKAKKQMLDKQMKIASKGREAKNPQEEYESSIYYHPDGGYGFPSVAFKSAAVGACRFDGTKMTVARGAFHVNDEFVKIEGEPRMREDPVGLPMNSTDLRYRAEFPDWKANVTVTYNKRALSKAQIISLFNLAGFGVGVGEWRPERNGRHGRFHVEIGG